MCLIIFRPTWQSLDLQIGTDGVKVVTKDRRIIELSFQEKEIEDIIMWQVKKAEEHRLRENSDQFEEKCLGIWILLTLSGIGLTYTSNWD